MPFCTNCGSQYKEGVNFCSECGQSTSVSNLNSTNTPSNYSKENNLSSKEISTLLSNNFITLAFNDGIYYGEYDKNIPHGKGLWFNSKGIKYIGEWNKGKAQGIGCLQETIENIYVGNFDWNSKHGYGIHYNNNHGAYEGYFTSGLKTKKVVESDYMGKLLLTNYDDGIYMGELSDSKPNGWGALIKTNGQTLWGEWRFGKLHGLGILESNDRTSYCGEFYEDARNGSGFTMHTDGSIYETEWSSNRKISEKAINYNKINIDNQIQNTNNNTLMTIGLVMGVTSFLLATLVL